MNHKKSDNGTPADPLYGLLDDDPADDLAPEGETLDLYWHFKDEALIDPKNLRNNGYLRETYQMLLDRIERLRGYELQALHFASTSDLLKWIRSDDDRMEWAWSNRTYSRLLQESK
jgi:hypothetical protein